MKFSGEVKKYSGGGVENYSVALTNFQGGCMGNFQEVFKTFSRMVGIFRERAEISFECLILFQLWLCYFWKGGVFQ